MATYWINRTWIKPTLWGGHGFFHDYLNDILLIPVFLPCVLWLHRLLRLRLHDRMPNVFEIAFHVVVWSICFLLIFPHQPWLFRHSTLDPMNAVAYAVGGLLSWLVWHAPWPYKRVSSSPSTIGGA